MPNTERVESARPRVRVMTHRRDRRRVDAVEIMLDWPALGVATPPRFAEAAAYRAAAEVAERSGRWGWSITVLDFDWTHYTISVDIVTGGPADEAAAACALAVAVAAIVGYPSNEPDPEGRSYVEIVRVEVAP